MIPEDEKKEREIIVAYISAVLVESFSFPILSKVTIVSFKKEKKKKLKSCIN